MGCAQGGVSSAQGGVSSGQDSVGSGQDSVSSGQGTVSRGQGTVSSGHGRVPGQFSLAGVRVHRLERAPQRHRLHRGRGAGELGHIGLGTHKPSHLGLKFSQFSLSTAPNPACSSQESLWRCQQRFHESRDVADHEPFLLPVPGKKIPRGSPAELGLLEVFCSASAPSHVCL